MAVDKKLTDRFLVALFRRGKAEFLPVSYLKSEGDKVLAKGETDKLPAMLGDLVIRGICAEKEGEYKLLTDPFA